MFSVYCKCFELGFVEVFSVFWKCFGFLEEFTVVLGDLQFTVL